MFNCIKVPCTMSPLELIYAFFDVPLISQDLIVQNKNLPQRSPRNTGAATPRSTRIVMTRSKSTMFLVVAFPARNFS